jgi:hypothetical protein
VIDHQLGRRNLFPYARAELAMIWERLVERRTGNQYTKSASVQIWTEADHPHRQAADRSCMGHSTYAKCKYIFEHADEERMIESQYVINHILTSIFCLT